jgi:hypothetical protein
MTRTALKYVDLDPAVLKTVQRSGTMMSTAQRLHRRAVPSDQAHHALELSLQLLHDLEQQADKNPA